MKESQILSVGFILICLHYIFDYRPKMTPLVTEVETMAIKKEILEEPCEEGVYYGIASYYGEKWNGRTTANMEIYDCNKLTCASPTLPFNTKLKVTNLDNGKSIIIRVNDRGPYKMDKNGRALRPLQPHPKRVLDLSKKSFESIGDLKKGLLRIKYEIVG